MNTLVRDGQGVLWIATNYEGLFRFDPATGRSDRFAAAPGDPGALPSGRIEALHLEKDGTLWAGTSEGTLSRFHPSTNRFRTFRPDAAAPDSLPGGTVRVLHEDRRGRLWIGTSVGLVRYDREQDRFVRYLQASGAEAGSRDVRALLEAPDGMLWLGSRAGLDRLDPSTGTLTSYRHDPADPTSLVAGPVSSLFLDRTGVFWVGTEQGASFFEWARPPFEHLTHDAADPNSLDAPDVWSIYEDRAGVLWVGTDAGLNRVDRAERRVTRYAPDPSDPSRLASGLVMGISETHDGSFWVAGRPGGLHRFDRATGRVAERFAEIPGDSTSLHSENPWWMLEDRNGRTWITSGGPGCLNEMHRAAGTFTRYCHDPADPNTPADDFARYLIEGRDGTLWLGTWGSGLDRIDPATGRFTHYRHDPADRNTPSSDFVLFLTEQPDGTLWLGTYGSGFSRFDPATGAFTHYTSQNSDLPSDIVYGIQPDGAGRLWLSTNAGLVRFDPATGAMRTFGVSDGIQALEFNSGASFRSASGELFFGGINGITAFYPEQIVDDPVVPTVVLTRLQVGGSPVLTYGPDSPLAHALPTAPEIRLRPHQRDLAITFAALHYVDPEQNQYRYRLDGYDDAWRTPGPERTATYTNLDPGRYVFRVRASNSDGVWNEQSTAIAVVVSPPWWQTWWALLGYIACLVGAVTVVHRSRQHRLRLQHRVEIDRLEAEKLRDLDRSKNAFFANVSHEFRTPLTLTLGPLDDVLAGEYGALPDDAAGALGLARRSAGRVLDLINQILDLARLEGGGTTLRVRHFDLGAFARAQTEAFAPLAARLRIEARVSVPDVPVEVWADPEHVGTILANVLSNAFKFTPEGGRVAVTVEAVSDEARVSVSDTGPGIAPADLARVFDRFYQAGSVEGRPLGSGIGLALAHDLAALHHGTLTAESRAESPGQGSTFTLALPLGRAHLGAFQISDVPWDGDVAPANWVVEAPAVSEDGRAEDDVTTVLVADDNADIRAYVRRHLEAAGYRVDEAADGEAALESVRAHLPDLVVSDVMMPRLDGLGLCRALRSDPETAFVPILLLTARAAPEDRLDGLAEACDDYITKPFDVRELVARVDNLIGLRRRLRERFASAARTSGDGGMAETPIASADEAFVAAVRSAIAEHLGDETFSVSALAEAVGQSRSQLLRRTTALMGAAPSDLLRTARMDRAAALLAAQAGTVSEVAYAVGFKSVAHFSNAFLAHTGTRPSAYAETER